ncbi:MAG: VOC family protein, partial [Bacteroidales bacterium]|nr:VOC family protein [Bacteroidales bacterium]
AAEAFYTPLLALVGGSQIYRTDRALVYAFGENGTRFAVNLPFDGAPATSGNGSMVALGATGQEQVKEVHSLALELGGSCEGAPGDRYGGALYAAYFRDPEGNKFGVLYMPG